MSNHTHFNLPPLSFLETKEFLFHLLSSQENYQKFAKKFAKKIHELSSGYPGRIDRVAMQIVSEMTKKIPGSFLRKRKISLFDGLLMLTIASLLLVFGRQIYLNLPAAGVFIQHSSMFLTQGTIKKIPSPLLPIKKPARHYPSFIASIESLPEEKL